MQSTPAMCLECGMALVRSRKQEVKSEHDHALHGTHAGHSTNVFKQKFWVSLILTIPILLYSPLLRTFFGVQLPGFAGSVFIPLILSSIVFWYGGWIFLVSALRELKGKVPGMMTLISLAITTAYVYSVIQVARGLQETLFWELTTLIVVMLLGHWIEMRAVTGAQSALKELSKMLPDTAEVEANGNIKTVPLSQLVVGDVVIIRPGGKVAADGEVIEGMSDVNESLITGESRPVQKTIGSHVIAGAINGNGSLRVRVLKIGNDTFLAGVVRLIQEAQTSKSNLQLLSDKAAFYLTVLAVAVGLLTLFVWLPLKGADFGFARMVAVLVITCPHALGLAIPLVASISTTMAARNGLLIRQRLSLEAARSVDVVLFDKTGTLTKGEYGVTGVLPVGGFSESDVLVLAASVDAKSEHSVARAIVQKAQENGASLSAVSGFARMPGKGVMGIVEGKTVRVGGSSLLAEVGIRAPSSIHTKVGDTVIYVVVDDAVAGVITLGDSIRQESHEAVQKLQAQNIEVALVSGDSEGVARWVAQELGITKYFAGVLPEQKSKKVKELQAQGKKVAMVGDGINDAPALTQADVGIAIGAGTNVAVESAGIVLVKNDPRDIPKIITLSKLTYTKIIQNLFWATGYNIIALPLAAGVAAMWGIILNPAISAIFMSLSTVIVAVNAVMLKRQTL